MTGRARLHRLERRAQQRAIEIEAAIAALAEADAATWAARAGWLKSGEPADLAAFVRAMAAAGNADAALQRLRGQEPSVIRTDAEAAAVLAEIWPHLDYAQVSGEVHHLLANFTAHDGDSF